MKIFYQIALIIITILNIIISSPNDRILIYPFKQNNSPAEPYVIERLQKELDNLGYKNFVPQSRIEYFLKQIKIDLENCTDSCLYSIGTLANADKIITGYIISDSNNYSIHSSIRSVQTGLIISEITYEASDENDLYQFGIYYISRGLTKQRLPDEHKKGKMHTVSVKSLFINHVDFFKFSNGDPYPIIFVLTENSIPIWKITFSNLRGYRTVNEKQILSFSPNNQYKIKIYDAKLKQLNMEYIIESEPKNWPFSTNKYRIGEESYILFDQKVENDFYYTPNKKILLY